MVDDVTKGLFGHRFVIGAQSGVRIIKLPAKFQKNFLVAFRKISDVHKIVFRRFHGVPLPLSRRTIFSFPILLGRTVGKIEFGYVLAEPQGNVNKIPLPEKFFVFFVDISPSYPI